MEILSPRFPGIYFICEQCGAVIANVKENEIYNEHDVYCPICKFKNELNYSKSYDGIVIKTEDKIITEIKDEEQLNDTSQPNNE